MDMMKGRLLKFATLGLPAGFLVIALSYLLFITFFNNRFFPGTKIAGMDVGGQTPATIYRLLNSQFTGRVSEPLIFTYRDQTYSLTFAAADPEIDLKQQVDAAYAFGRSGNFLPDLFSQLQTLTSGKDFPLAVTYSSKSKLDRQIGQIGLLIKKNPVNAQLNPGSPTTISPSQDGEELDESNLTKQIGTYLSLTNPAPQTLPTKTIPPQFSTAAAERAKKALENVKLSPIKLRFGGNSWTIDETVLLSLLDFNQTKPVLASADLDNGTVTIENITVGKNKFTDSKLLLDKNKLANYLKDLSDKINQPTQDAKFSFNETSKRVVEFQPEQEGRELDIERTATLITQALESREGKDITLPVKVTKPKINAASINNYGIRELLGKGVSHFAGSIENRIYNIGLAASRINGTLIPPGETFSFNGVVGEISGASGYKQAYVIKSGRTVLDDGGGVCQVSTTLFRAVLNSGLPILARTAHAYRVGYYEQGFPPGLDATVFSPTVDFKFKNDTPAHILIQAYVSGASLYVDIYGTSDGRIARLSTPVVTNQTPPPPELRQDDPTLPKGTVKQVDWSAWGANVSFKRTVTRGPETLISETFRSNFKPWQAVYLVGTQ